MNELIKASDVTKILGISRATLYNWMNKGILPRGYKLGHVRRWFLSEVLTALETLKHE